jgi:uncharacterized membrane protein
MSVRESRLTIRLELIQVNISCCGIFSGMTVLKIALIAVAMLAGQGGAEKTGISGILFDRNDARIAGAVIRIEKGDFRRRLRSDDEGKFEVELPAGSYELRVEQPGFRTLKLSSIRVNEGVIERLHLYLEVAAPKGPLKVKPQVD